MRYEAVIATNKRFIRSVALLFTSSATTLLSGCHSKEITALDLYGNYVMDTKYGRCELTLADHGAMYERVYPKQGGPKAVRGTWTKTTDGVFFTPFLRFEPLGDGAPISYVNTELTTDTDVHGIPQLVVSDDFGWWFRRA